MKSRILTQFGIDEKIQNKLLDFTKSFLEADKARAQLSPEDQEDEILFVFYYAAEVLQRNYKARLKVDNGEDEKLVVLPHPTEDFLDAFFLALKHALDLKQRIKITAFFPDKFNYAKSEASFLEIMGHEIPPYHDLMIRVYKEIHYEQKEIKFAEIQPKERQSQYSSLLKLDEKRSQEKAEKLEEKKSEENASEEEIAKEKEGEEEVLEHYYSPSSEIPFPEESIKKQKEARQLYKEAESFYKEKGRQQIKRDLEQQMNVVTNDIQKIISSESIKKKYLHQLDRRLKKIKNTDYEALVTLAVSYKGNICQAALIKILKKYREMRDRDNNPGSFFTYYKESKVGAVDYLLDLLQKKPRAARPPLVERKFRQALRQGSLKKILAIFDDVLPKEFNDMEYADANKANFVTKPKYM